MDFRSLFLTRMWHLREIYVCIDWFVLYQFVIDLTIFVCFSRLFFFIIWRVCLKVFNLAHIWTQNIPKKKMAWKESLMLLQKMKKKKTAKKCWKLFHFDFFARAHDRWWFIQINLIDLFTVNICSRCDANRNAKRNVDSIALMWRTWFGSIEIIEFERPVQSEKETWCLLRLKIIHWVFNQMNCRIFQINAH